MPCQYHISYITSHDASPLWLTPFDSKVARCLEHLLARTYCPDSSVFFEGDRSKELLLMVSGRIQLSVATTSAASGLDDMEEETKENLKVPEPLPALTTCQCSRPSLKQSMITRSHTPCQQDAQPSGTVLTDLVAGDFIGDFQVIQMTYRTILICCPASILCSS